MADLTKELSDKADEIGQTDIQKDLCKRANTWKFEQYRDID